MILFALLRLRMMNHEHEHRYRCTRTYLPLRTLHALRAAPHTVVPPAAMLLLINDTPLSDTATLFFFDVVIVYVLPNAARAFATYACRVCWCCA